jgi:hypothetical protein
MRRQVPVARFVDTKQDTEPAMNPRRVALLDSNKSLCW